MSRSILLMGTLALGIGLVATGCPNGPNLGATNNASPAPSSASASVTPAPATMALNLSYADMPANSWTVGSPMAHERVGLSAAASDGRLYVIGGDGEATLERYDPYQDRWQLQPLPTTANPGYAAYAPYRTRYFGAAVVSGRRLIYVGGTSDFLSSSFDIIDPDAQAWLDLSSPAYEDARFARMAHAAVNLDEVFYVMGGLMSPLGGGDPEPSGDVFSFSPLNGETYLKPSLPAPRAGLGAAAFDHRLYVVGGYSALPTSGSAVATGSMLCYSVGDWNDKTQDGASLASLNVPRHSFGSAVLNGKWYVAGGMDSAGHVLDSVEEYDPSTNTWKLKAAMLTPRVHLALGAVGDRLFAMGGYDAQNRQLRSVDVFRP